MVINKDLPRNFEDFILSPEKRNNRRFPKRRRNRNAKKAISDPEHSLIKFSPAVGNSELKPVKKRGVKRSLHKRRNFGISKTSEQSHNIATSRMWNISKDQIVGQNLVKILEAEGLPITTYYQTWLKQYIQKNSSGKLDLNN